MNYIEVAIQATTDAGDVLALLKDCESAGAWEAEGVLRLYWPEDKWDPSVLAELKTALDQMGIKNGEDILTIRLVPDQDWNADWASSLRPIRIGRRIRIRQSWNAPDLSFDGVELVIDPKRAFGSGYHATTQLVIEWLEEQIRGGERILDVGTGSGILAMAALRLGAASALAVDNDPVALECAREYCDANGFGPELQLRVSSFEDLDPVAYDFIVANLDIRTMPLFCRHLPRLLKPDGKACLCGLQHSDLEEVSEVLSQGKLRIEGKTERDEWISLSVEWTRPFTPAGGPPLGG
jgi:ribosomal protein L11 methyltransferase